jgi:hypothetical protein
VVGFAIWLVCLVITDNINDSVAGNIAMSLLSVLVAIAGTIVGVVVYVLPTIIAARRNMPHVGSIAVVNVFLGFTYVGWVVALAMAVAGKPVNR